MNAPHSNPPIGAHRDRRQAQRFPFAQPVDTPAEQFANWLPYSAYLAPEKIFVNRDSMGVMLELMPQSGADERMAEVLVSLYANCPPGTGIQFHLFGSPQVRTQLRHYANLRVEDEDQAEQAKQWGRPARNGNLFRKLARQRVGHLLQGAQKSLTAGFHYTIRDFRLMLSVAFPGDPEDLNKRDELMALRDSMSSTLRSASLPNRVCDAADLINWCALFTNPDRISQTDAPDLHYDDGRELRDQIVDFDTIQDPHPSGLTLWKEASPEVLEARFFSIKSFPERFALWQMAAVAFCGFVAALIAYAFAPEKLQGWKWLGTVVLVFSVLIVPKVTVGIVDKTGGSAVKVVDNVPFGVAVLGSLTSTIGNTLTGLFETAFQVIPGAGALPAELSYQQNGLMFGNRLIRETGNVVFQDPAFRTDLINFIHNCTTYDLIDGTLDPATFSASDDVWPLMASPNPARFSTLTAAGGSVGVDTCPNVYQSLNGRLPAQITRIQGRLAFQLNPTLPGAAAAAVIAGQIQQAYLKNSIATAAATAADLIRQNAVLNAIEDTSKIVGQKVNDPAAMVLAVGRAQAVAQQNATWLNYGKVAEQALPVFRNVVEAVTYAMFPLFVLLLLLTSGRETMLAFKGYAAVLIWIQLWPPLYAILNYMASIYAAYDLAAAADLGTGTKALALQTASTIYSRAISGEAVVGYLAISIPFIAWAALKRMENFGTALVGGLSGLQAMISGGTSSSAVGNVSMGNVGMDQMQLAPNRTSAFMGSWQNDLSGNTFSSNALTGRTAVSLLRNQGFASRVVSMRVSEQDVVQASRQADAARNEAVAASTERSAVLSDAFSRGLTKLRSSRNSSGSTSSSFEQMGESLNRLDQIAKGVADSTGLSQSQVASIAFGVSGRLGLETGVASASVHANGGKAYQSSLTADERKVLSTMSSEQLAEFKQFGDRVSRDASFMNVVAKDSREAHDMVARLASTHARSERAEASLAERTAFAERMSAAHEKGEAISIDIAQDPYNLEMFMHYAEQYGGNSAAAHALMESELARQSLRPNRVFSDGTALPASFGDIRDQHVYQRGDAAMTPDIGGLHQSNREQTSRFGNAKPSQGTAPTVSPIRDEIRTHGDQIRTGAESSRANFDAKAEIIKTDDGTLASKKSLLVQSGKQVGKDAAATLDNAKGVVKDLLRK